MISFSLDQAQRFLEALSSKLPGDHTFTFQTFGDGKHRKKIKELRRIRHGTLEEHADELKRLNRKGAGIFVTVNMTDGKGREEENVVGLRAAFVDADNIDLLEIFKNDPDVDSCYPNILVQSKRGYHAYWLLDRWEGKDTFTPLQLALIEKFGTDPEPRDLPRVMRLPGFFHMKDEPEEICSKETFKKAIQEGRATKVTLEHVDTFCDVSGHEKNGELRDGDRRGYRVSRLVDLLHLNIPDITPAWKKQGYTSPKTSSSTTHFPPEFRVYLAQNYLHRIHPPTKGSGNAHETVGSACRVGHDFDVDMDTYWPILREWGARCSPPFIESDLRYEYETFLKATKYPPGSKLYDKEYNREAQYKNWLRARGFDVSPAGEIYRGDDVPWSTRSEREISKRNCDLVEKLPPSSEAPVIPFSPDFPPDAHLINEPLDPIDEHMLKDEQNRIKRALEKEKTEKKKREEKRKELAAKGPGYLIWTDHGEPPKLSKTKDGRYKMRPQHPRETAWHFLNVMCKTNDGIRTLHFHNDRFVQWDGVCYQRFKPDGYRQKPAQFLALCAEEIDREDSDDQPMFKQFKVLKNRKSELLEALRDLVSLDESIHAPCWLIDNDHLPDPREIIVCQNGLLDVRNNRLLPPNPALFSLNSIAIEYNPDAPPPTEFLAFLDSVFENDEESKKLLKWWFGYCLTQDTRHQKMLMLVGESRSGKGVITRLLEKLVGPQAYGSMKFHKMDANFAMSSAIDKTVLVFPDARIGGKTDQSAVVADLLSITGEDKMFIDRKNLDPINVKLNCRIMTVSNEPLKLHDTSGALRNRLLLINFPKGRAELEQDRGLEDRLDKELSGILNWAIDGWKELQEFGRFFQPKSGEDQLNVFSERSSPMKQFIEDLCKIGPNETIEIKTIYNAWKFWSEIMNYKPGSLPVFGSNIQAAIPSIKKERPRDGKKRISKYAGICIDENKLREFVDLNTNFSYDSIEENIWPGKRQTKIPGTSSLPLHSGGFKN